MNILIVILALAASVIVMGIINALGGMEINYLFTIVGGLWLIINGISLPAIGTAAAVGLGIGAIRQQPLSGISPAVTWWVTKGLPAVILAWWAISAFLASWSFEKAPLAMIPLVVFGLLIFWACVAYGKLKGETTFWIIVVYSIGMVVLSLLQTTPLGKWFEKTPPAYNATGTNWLMNPVNRDVFKTEPQAGCIRRSDCYDPSHATGGRATRLVPYDARAKKRQAQQTDQTPQQAAVPPPGPAYLDESAYTTRAFGKFEPLQVRHDQRVGPINLYEGSCPYWYKSGIGQITILSRPDFTSEPVPAVMNDRGFGVKEWGHPGPAYQMFFESTSRNQIELERREGNDSCS